MSRIFNFSPSTTPAEVQVFLLKHSAHRPPLILVVHEDDLLLLGNQGDTAEIVRGQDRLVH